MSKYVLKKIKDARNKFDAVDITFEIDTVCRSELIEQFISFLEASGYSVDDLKKSLSEYYEHY